MDEANSSSAHNTSQITNTSYNEAELAALLARKEELLNNSKNKAKLEKLLAKKRKKEM